MVDEVFFETSALIDFLFWDKATRAKIAGLFSPKARKVTSRFVIFEVCRGFLRNLILLHNRSLQMKHFDELMLYAGHSQLAHHRLGTILGAFQAFFRLPSAYQASTSVQRLAEFRGNLRRKIRRGYQAMEGEMDAILNDIGCRDDLQAPEQDADGYFEQELRKVDCGTETNCGLRAYYVKNRKTFEAIRMALNPPIDRETERRRFAMRALYRVQGRPFDRNHCYQAGDATISHESPQQTVLVSKNQKHISPIVGFLGKTAVFYS